MSKGLEMKVPSNLNKIDTNDLGEFIWWCAHIGIAPEKLLSIISKVGHSVEAVRKELNQSTH